MLRGIAATIVAVSTAFFLTRCEIEPAVAPGPLPIVSFAANNLSLGESDGELVLGLNLNHPAPHDTHIEVKVSPLTTLPIETEPAVILGTIRVPVKKGATGVSIKIRPINNARLDGERQASLTIKPVADRYMAGDGSLAQVAVTDDEVPSLVVFHQTEGNSLEGDAAGLTVNLNLSAPAPAAGIVIIESVSASQYGVDYFTQPSMVNGKLYLPVAEGQSTLTMKVFSVENTVKQSDRQIFFRIGEVSGGVTSDLIGGFALTVIDDDSSSPLSTIRAVRTLFQGSPVILQGERIIEGTVTSVGNFFLARTVLQDESAAITVTFSFQNNFKRGDRLRVNLNHGELRELYGVLEVTQVSEAVKIAESPIAYRIFNLGELFEAGDEIESQMVRIMDLNFTSGGPTMFGDRTVTDGTRNIIVRTTAFADFKNEPIPVGKVSIGGIITYANGNFILYPQIFSEDVATNL